MGWWRNPKVCLWCLATSCPSYFPTWSPLGPGRRQPTFWWWPTHIHCDGFASKQNLPTFQRNPDIPSPCSADVDYPEFTPFLTKVPYWWALASLYSVPLPYPQQPHHSQRHRPLQTSLSRSRLPQRGQASYIPTNLLPRTLLPVPHYHLRRSVGISQIGAKPEWHHREDHRRDQPSIWQSIPMGTWCWTRPTECLCSPQTEETVQGRATHCQLLHGTFPTYVELHRQADLQPSTPSVSPQPGKGWCIWSHQAPQGHRLWFAPYSTNTQPRSCGFFHKYWHWPLHR